MRHPSTKFQATLTTYTTHLKLHPNPGMPSPKSLHHHPRRSYAVPSQPTNPAGLYYINPTQQTKHKVPKVPKPHKQNSHTHPNQELPSKTTPTYNVQNNKPNPTTSVSADSYFTNNPQHNTRSAQAQSPTRNPPNTQNRKPHQTLPNPTHHKQIHVITSNKNPK